MCICVSGAEEVGTRNMLNMMSVYSQCLLEVHVQLVSVDGDDRNGSVL